MLHPPYYDVGKTYEENYETGPFNGFSDGVNWQQEGEPKNDFFGKSVYLPFGIPAGPLINARFVRSAFQKGFDVCIYKTVRTTKHHCHPWPNVVPIEIDGDLTEEKRRQGLIMADHFSEPLSATNSFGVPSMDPTVWQEDMKEAVQSAGKGQIMVASFQGTHKGHGVKAFIQDHVDGAILCTETGAQVLEVNLSCPNEGTADLLCYDTDRVVEIAYNIKKQIGNVPLLIKIGYFEDTNKLRDFIKRLGTIVDGISMINTLAAAVRNKNGQQALPGEGRLVSGIIGKPIKWAGIEMVKKSIKLREEFKYSFKIVASGGVTSVADYKDYISAGADAVMSAAGSMWNPYLAQEIKKEVVS